MIDRINRAIQTEIAPVNKFFSIFAGQQRGNFIFAPLPRYAKDYIKYN